MLLPIIITYKAIMKQQYFLLLVYIIIPNIKKTQKNVNSLSLPRGISNDRLDVFRLSSLHGEMLVAMFV